MNLIPHRDPGNRIGWGSVSAFMRYGDRWRKQRKMMQQFLSPQGVTSYRGIQAQYVKILLNDLLVTPADFDKVSTRYALQP